ncbi:MAG: chemotaxis protein CheW [Actinobacteria bacterium]|nr:chemotaxis protein CheW [Actinomycetota bacterium]
MTLAPPVGSDLDGHLDVVVVEVDGVRCGLTADEVVELHQVVLATPLPGAPSAVEGVVDLRGTLVAVFDLRARLGLRRRPPILSDHLVFTRVDARLAALRVDRAVDLVRVSTSRIESALALAPAPYVSGVARLDDGLVLIHDPGTFLSGEEVVALDEALAALEPGTPA